jgi:hypothetical protein
MPCQILSDRSSLRKNAKRKSCLGKFPQKISRKNVSEKVPPRKSSNMKKFLDEKSSTRKKLINENIFEVVILMEFFP